MASRRPPPCSARDKSSFAFESVAHRWPVILTDIINVVHDGLETGERAAQGKLLINGIQELKYKIAHNKPLDDLEEGGEANAEIYNRALQHLRQEDSGTWIEGPWLYNECYMYRQIRSLFLAQPLWRHVDPFESSKTRGFRSNGKAVFTLASSLQKLVQNKVDHQADEQLRHAAFLELIQANLWGNASGDLSLFAGLSAEDIDALQNSSGDSENIIRNDLDAVWQHLKKLKDARIDIVLDNSGFELFTDLIVGDWLLSCTPYCSSLRLHPKNIPWFVSDVLPKDVELLLSQLESPDFFISYQPSQEEAGALKQVIKRWRQYLEDGTIAIQTNDFWTSPSSFDAMPNEAPELLADLQGSKLVLFKGDLNYRKLTGDLTWPHHTAFGESLGALQGKLDLVTLRTCKADVVVGLREGQAEELQQKDPRWRWNGKWGIVAFSQRDR